MELTKSEQIRAGLQKSFQSGTSAKASTVCYGYKVSRAGELVIDPAEADTVLFIFHHFMNGDSLGNISGALARKGIASPTGRVTWSRETISKLLANEKYVGDVVLGKQM
nr:recombinase family protein [uncultured Oscillibacter sp.]